MVQLKEEILALVNEKEKLGRERSEVKHSLENVSEQLETAQNELVTLKVTITVGFKLVSNGSLTLVSN